VLCETLNVSSRTLQFLPSFRFVRPPGFRLSGIHSLASTIAFLSLMAIVRP
jgi:hypothetical protein